MSAATSSQEDGQGNSVPDEISSISGKFQDFSTTVKFSVDSVKERFNQTGQILLDSHEFTIDDESFKIQVQIDDLKNANRNNSSTARWAGVFLFNTETLGKERSIVSLKLELHNKQVFEFKNHDLEMKNGWGWQKVLNKAGCETLPNNTLDLHCTVTLHSKAEDVLSIKRSRCGANLANDELARIEKERLGLPSSKDKLFTDFVIESEDGLDIKCHRVFLASHSSVFKAMLESDMTEARDRRLKLDFCGELLQHFVDFLYDTTLDTEIVLKHYEEFLNLSEQYDIKRLKLQTEDILMKNLSTELMTDYYVLGDLYNAENLKEAARTFMVNNKDWFKDKEFTEQLQKLHPERIVEIMRIVV